MKLNFITQPVLVAASFLAVSLFAQSEPATQRFELPITLNGKKLNLLQATDHSSVQALLKNYPEIKKEITEPDLIQTAVSVNAFPADIWLIWKFKVDGALGEIVVGGYDAEHCPQVAEIAGILNRAGAKSAQSPSKNGGKDEVWNHGGFRFTFHSDTNGNDASYSMTIQPSKS